MFSVLGKRLLEARNALDLVSRNQSLVTCTTNSLNAIKGIDATQHKRNLGTVSKYLGAGNKKDVLVHTTAKPSHYNEGAEHYDAFNDENSRVINDTIGNILKEHKVKTVLDLTCGTGSQVFWLAKQGYEVVGSDINSKMLKVAESKAKIEKISVKFLRGDMRSIQLGKFDAAITIFNAVGHLTKFDFEKTMQNIHGNLKVGGLYIFDINNLSYLMKDNNITKLTIDWQKIDGGTKVRDIQYSTIEPNGVLASYTTSYEQRDTNKPKVSKSAQTLQLYTAIQLRDMLSRNGFKVIRQCEMDGSVFSEDKSENIVTVAKSISTPTILKP